MPKLVRLYIESVFVGFALAGIFAGLLVWQDVGGLGRLIYGSDVGGLALVLLLVLNGTLFSAAQFGIRVMALDSDTGSDGGTGGRAAPARIRVTSLERRIVRDR